MSIHEKSVKLVEMINGPFLQQTQLLLKELDALWELVNDKTTVPEIVSIWNAYVEVLKITKLFAPLEMEVRKGLFMRAFPAPKENTNTLELGGGWKLKAVHKLDRNIDEGVLPDVIAELQKMNINTDILIKYRPELELAVYRTLTEEVLNVFNQAITTKPGSPQMELVPPKDKK